MPLLSWSDSYSVNSPSIDTQHKKLFDLVNELHDAMLAGKGRDVIGKTLAATVDYAGTHFADEENFMAKYKYPDLPAHKAEHNAFVQKVFELQSEYRAGKSTLTFATMDFLKNWLTNHILKVDKLYAVHITRRDSIP